MELTLDRLTLRRGGRTLIRDLSYTLPAGRAAALRGPNGVGKSTLLRALCGFLPLAEGRVQLGELTLPGDRTAIQERVLYAGHLDAVKPALSFAENLRLWAELGGAGEGRAAEALERFGIAHMADRPAGEGSAGQKRRLGLARMVVLERPLWLLDEPTVSLDRDSTALVADLIAAHVAAGGLALIATHVDLGIADLGELTLTPPGPEPAEAEPDPFLAGSW
jgi:heme exporter protein A